ncbi:MAG TPA: protein phosphatase 2C domain-containing protein, partial [Gemmatimonadales bacterium]|nr:protein phosphatase 2C domain-containing protein [Gemmatimonadales bacterium]
MTVATGSAVAVRPVASDIDVFGLTHQGKVRRVNQDQFLIASLHKTMQVHASSVPATQLGDLTSESRLYLCIVADGVGGRPGGEQASGTALKAIAQYATHTMKLSSRHDEAQEGRFLEELERAVAESHAAVREDPESSATTLTMAVFRWPRAYLVHVGDSRCYRLREGKLELLTKDHTMAQALVDAGVLPPAEASATRWAHVLSSALGAEQPRPDIITLDSRWEDVMLLCTDGLTKHVAEDEITEQLATVKSSEMICR